MATAHLIHGYLGVGKSTFARQLESETGGIRLSPDDVMVTLFGHDPSVERFRESLHRVESLLDDLWPRILGAGVDVVLDFGFWRRHLRDAARTMAAEAGGDCKLYWVTCSDVVALARCLVRNGDLGDSIYIDENTFDLLKERFEPLGADESFELIETGDRS
jgi:predicted kinase